MKHPILVALLLIVITACEDNDPVTPELEGEQWQLVKMWGQVPNSETTGEDMEWQEYYLLMDDDTFIKSRTRDGVVEEAGGKYSFQELADGTYLVLDYEEDSALMGNCFGNQQEQLFLETEKTLIGTWQACDGPGLEYERVE